MNPLRQITPAMIRDGAPAALAVLCEKRGAAVYAYCKLVVGDAHAGTAAAEAFARFRLAAVAPGSLTGSRQAEELLRHGTRRAALSLAAREGLTDPERCADRQDELLAYVEDSLAPPAREGVEAHVAGCRTCAATLHRLQAAEPAFRVPAAKPPPPPVTGAILTALAGAAPVSAYDGDATAVRDEALRLINDAAPATSPAPAAPANEPVEQPASLPEPAEVGAPGEWEKRGLRSRLPDLPRLPRLGGNGFAHGRADALLRRSAKFFAAALAGATVGILLGMGIAELRDRDAGSPQPSAGGAATVVATSGGRLRIDILSATVRPLDGDSGERARVTVRARIDNTTDRVATPQQQPLLLVDDERVALAPGSSTDAEELLASPIDAGETAAGTLRFDTETTPDELAAAEVRLRMADKNVTLPLEPATSG